MAAQMQVWMVGCYMEVLSWGPHPLTYLPGATSGQEGV